MVLFDKLVQTLLSVFRWFLNTDKQIKKTWFHLLNDGGLICWDTWLVNQRFLAAKQPIAC